MAKVIKFKGRDNVLEYDSCNLYCLSPINPAPASLNCVLFYDIRENCYRLNVYNSEETNLFSNLFSDIGLSFKELIKILSIYNIEINKEISDKIRNEPNSKERKQKYDLIISKVDFI